MKPHILLRYLSTMHGHIWLIVKCCKDFFYFVGLLDLLNMYLMELFFWKFKFQWLHSHSEGTCILKELSYINVMFVNNTYSFSLTVPLKKRKTRKGGRKNLYRCPSQRSPWKWAERRFLILLQNCKPLRLEFWANKWSWLLL